MYIPIIISNKNDKNDKNDKNNKTLNYFVPPIIMQSYYEYQDVNKDINLRVDVINFFFNKLLKWVKNDDLFKKYEKYETSLNNKKTKRKLYKLLRSFIKKSNNNWYELRDNYLFFKEFLYKHFDLLL
jgi:hypothetical protein